MRKWIIASAVALLLVLIAFLGLRRTIQAVIRERTQKILQTHFASKVEFSGFDVTLFPRVHVTITGLALRYRGRPDTPPLVQAAKISMYANLPSLWRSKPHISFVQLF